MGKEEGFVLHRNAGLVARYVGIALNPWRKPLLKERFFPLDTGFMELEAFQELEYIARLVKIFSRRSNLECAELNTRRYETSSANGLSITKCPATQLIHPFFDWHEYRLVYCVLTGKGVGYCHAVYVF